MSRVQVKDYTREFLAVAENEIEAAIARSAVAVSLQTQKLLNQHRSLPPASPSPPGSPPGNMTGNLSRSIDFETFRRAGAFVGRVGSNLPYALAQEIGKTITAKGKKLTVPLGTYGRAVMHRVTSIRSLSVRFVKRPGKPTLVIERSSGTPIAVLKDSVTLPPRPYLRPALAMSRKRILKHIADAGRRMERRGRR